ncbi:hypothetical protein ABFS82_13G187700 [Erythranthe guttata]|uniref:Myb-like domain-containing protein n=1 Tax=Erythranthe guttata TaxID=4155 RepID=A0A022RVB1_ERYGU|nr:PREDICTED: formin-like protein 7 isoform X1 [Erythranthe guttata]EYU43703.1 hypothetical protein MIMGU_mgv1a008977mg [Erythranthe guttata]|eukprot:XP_012829771.1 PREDICTED: formin-like protein 7 isoform X1 [Erythranthe guttata]
MDLTVANRGGNINNNNVSREYRKGNWNIQETMVLIEAKRMDDDRRMKRLGDTAERGKPAELRWKWVEDYCWKNDCLRSQNQCNDKWDNLMRDFKKVRDYERRVAERGFADSKSYWRIEKNERKDNNLPSNMLPQIYDALVAVVERKDHRVVVAAPPPPPPPVGGGSNSNIAPPPAGNVVGKSTIVYAPMPPLPPPVQQQYPNIVQARPVLLPLPPPPPIATIPSSQPMPTVDSDTSEYSDSPAKRRRKRRGGGEEGTSGGGGGDTAALQEVGSAITKSASMIAEAIQSCEEREERRHRQVLRVHERRLQIEESKAEINKQGINGLVDAINKLATSILALAATNKNNQPPPPPSSSK